MASPPPREMEEEPGDPRAKPPVKPKPRALPAKPALPVKPSLLVPVGPRPPRGPLAELPSARKMNMLAGPQPYGGSKRPLPFAPRPTAEPPTGGEAPQETGKEEVPPLTPPARCATPGGVRKAPAPFRPASERFAATTVEEILAKMEQPRKEVPASPDRLWGSRLTFNHDGSSRYGPRTYGVATSPRDEDGGSLSRMWSQEAPAKSPMECQEEHSKTPEERSPRSNLAFNGDLARPASSEPPANVPQPWVPSSPGPASPGLPAKVSAPVPESPLLHSPDGSSPCHSQVPEAPSPSASGASPHLPATPASPSPALPAEGSCHPPSCGLPAEGTPEALRPCSPPLKKVSGHNSPEEPSVPSPQPLIEAGELLDIPRTFPSQAEAVVQGNADRRPISLAQRRFSEGVLRPPSQDQEKLGGSLAALPQTQGSQSALDHSFGCGTESNWSLSQSFEWTFPARPSGLGIWRLDSPPPSPITEASEATEAAEASDLAVSEEGISEQGTWSAPERPGGPSSQVQGGDPGASPTLKGNGESQPQSPAVPLEPLPAMGGPLWQAEERQAEQEPLAGQESPLPAVAREAALPILEPVLGQQQPAPPDQPCVLFADGLDPGQALAAEEEAVTLAQAETTQPRTGAQDPCRASPEPVGPEASSRWLDDLLASPPPCAGSSRRAAGPELKDTQTPSACSEGLLGWARKDLQSEFGIAVDPPPSSFSSSGWSQDTSQDYGLGGSSPRGDPGRGGSDWASKYGQGAGEGSPREWASMAAIGSGDRSEVSALGGLPAQDRVVGKPSWLQEAEIQDWEFGKRDSQGPYSSQDAELQDLQFGKRDSLTAYGSRDVSLQDQEFGKRDSLGPYSSRDASLQDQGFGKRDSLGTYGGQDVSLQDQEFGKRDSLGPYSSHDAILQDQGFGKRDSLSTYGSRDASLQDQEFGKRDSLGTYGSRDASLQDQEFGKRDSLGTYGSRDASLQDQEFGKSDSLGTYGSRDASLQDQELGKRDSLGTYGSRDTSLQDQEFGKRDSVGAFGSRDVSLRDWEFGKRDSLGAYTSQDASEQGRELGMRDLGRDADEQDWEFEKRAPPLGTAGSQEAEPQDRGLRNPSAWMSDYRGSSSFPDRGFGMRGLGAVFSPEEAQQQDQEFEKKVLGRGDSLGEASRDAGQPEGRDLGGLLSPSTPHPLDGAPGQRDQNNWQGNSASQEGRGLQGRWQAGAQSPGSADPGDGETEKQGWASGFSLHVTPQHEGALGLGQRDWSSDFCIDDSERSHEFGIIGDDRVSGADPSPSSKLGNGHVVPPGKTTVDWADHLGLRNLESPSCVGSGGSHEAREGIWSAHMGLAEMGRASHLGTGGSKEPRGIGVGEKNWTSDVGARSRDLAGAAEVGDHSQARESGVGQTNWSAVQAGEFLKSRELGVGQADWTADLRLRNMDPGLGCSAGEPRELGVGHVDWGSNLGLRNLEVSCDRESGDSLEPRGCGVGQMDWAQDLGLRDVELSQDLGEARERGVGEVGQCPQPGLRNNGALSPSLEARDPLEARELGVGETSEPETQGEDDSSPSLETRPEDTRMETGEAPGFAASPGGCPACPPPSGSQGLLEEMLAASCSKAAAHRESAASGLRGLSEEEGATAGSDQGEPLEQGRDPLPSWRPQPDGEASRTEEVDGSWGHSGAGRGEQRLAPTPRRASQGAPPSTPSQDFSFIEDTEVLDSAMYRSRANLGRKRGHRAPAIRPGGTLGLSDAADSDARLFQDSTEPRASRVPSSDEEVVEEPQSRRTRMSLGTKGLKVNLFPGLSPSALKAKLRSRNRSAEEGEPAESKSTQKEPAVQRSKSCKVPGLGKPVTLPPKPEKSSGSEGSSPNWLQALKLKKKKV